LRRRRITGLRIQHDQQRRAEPGSGRDVQAEQPQPRLRCPLWPPRLGNRDRRPEAVDDVTENEAVSVERADRERRDERRLAALGPACISLVVLLEQRLIDQTGLRNAQREKKQEQRGPSPAGAADDLAGEQRRCSIKPREDRKSVV